MDLTGERFGQIEVLYKMPDLSKDGHKQYMCRCKCGREWVIQSNYIKRINECRDCRKLKYYYHPELKSERKYYYIPDCGKRLLDVILKRNVNLRAMEKSVGINYSTIYNFLYKGHDTSATRLAKMCAYLDVSMDYIMGLKKEKT